MSKPLDRRCLGHAHTRSIKSYRGKDAWPRTYIAGRQASEHRAFYLHILGRGLVTPE